MQQTRMLVISIAILFSGMAMAFTEPPFPRIATVNYGGQQNYDNSAYEAQLARFNITIFQIYPGWVGDHTKTMNQSVQAIKAINPNELVFLYVSNNEVTTSGTAYAALRNTITSNHWWLYPSGTSGSPVPSSWPGALETNNTLFAKTDSNGDNYVNYYAKWAAQSYYVPSPSIDGFFTDNVFYQPRVNGDWNLDGVSDSDSNPTVGEWYRQGYAQHFAMLKQQMPGKYQIGNVTDWGAAGANLSSLTGILNGGLIEGQIGYSWSPETWASWSEMMRRYRVNMAAVAQPQLVIFGTAGVATDYQTVRYGLTSCLMDNGYYQFSILGSEYTGTQWFDEYGAQLGTANAGPSTTAWQKGVYRRDFANGIALVNPRGNGAQTVQLETAYRKLSGTQAPGINNGQTVQSVTLQDRDGIILMRTTAAAPSTQPAPPASVTVH